VFTGIGNQPLGLPAVALEKRSTVTRAALGSEPVQIRSGEDNGVLISLGLVVPWAIRVIGLTAPRINECRGEATDLWRCVARASGSACVLAASVSAAIGTRDRAG
jgi:hypothetical protein